MLGVEVPIGCFLARTDTREDGEGVEGEGERCGVCEGEVHAVAGTDISPEILLRWLSLIELNFANTIRVTSNAHISCLHLVSRLQGGMGGWERGGVLSHPWRLTAGPRPRNKARLS